MNDEMSVYGTFPPAAPWGLEEPSSPLSRTDLSAVPEGRALPLPVSSDPLSGQIEPPLPSAGSAAAIEAAILNPLAPPLSSDEPASPETMEQHDLHDGDFPAVQPYVPDFAIRADGETSRAPFLTSEKPHGGHTEATPEIIGFTESVANGFYQQPLDEESEDEGLHSEEGGNARMWSDRDYPFLPRPRGGKLKGARKGRIRQRKLRLPKPVMPGMAKPKCPICGGPMIFGHCFICTTYDTCPECGQALTEGRCTNQECRASKSKCPECGRDEPCNCGFEK